MRFTEVKKFEIYHRTMLEQACIMVKSREPRYLAMVHACSMINFERHIHGRSEFTVNLQKFLTV